ncbi:MAG: vWA domain-containing protein [Spirochaetota bacterium]
MRKYIFALLIVWPVFHASPLDLTITSDDLYIEQGRKIDNGYHLWIRKKADIGSILITESTADPEKKVDSFALRAMEYNSTNGGEMRMLDGKFLDQDKNLYSLIDSTPEKDRKFGEAFHIFIPQKVEYGYPWSRYGIIEVQNGTWLNIRAFNKQYGDYSGAFTDNPFILRVSERVVKLPVTPPVEEPAAEVLAMEETPEEELPEESYIPETVKDFTEIAKEGKGEAILSLGQEELINEIKGIIDGAQGKQLDLVLALDTTQSMENDIPYLRTMLIPLLEKETSRFERFRMGMVLYKDYMESYITMVIPFRDGLNGIQPVLNNIKVSGGRDIPEAVFEALYAGIHSFPWEAEARLIILIGDAPPHPTPWGSVTKEMVYNDAGDLNIEINTIILPQ